MTTYSTTEGMGFVELCAVMPAVAPRPFVISATTFDETAGIELQHQFYCSVSLAFTVIMKGTKVQNLGVIHAVQ